MRKHPPMLLDTWQKIIELKPGIERHLKAATPTARRFVFDAEACAHVGHLLYTAGDLVAEQIVFAKPPYENTYIELIDARAMFDAWRPPTPGRLRIPGDSQLGLLYTADNGHLFSFCANDQAGKFPNTLGMFQTDIGVGQTTPLHHLWGDFGMRSAWGMKASTDKVRHEIIKLAYLLGGMRQPDGTIVMVRADYDYFLANYNLTTPLDLPNADGAVSIGEAAFLGGGDLLIGAACLLLIHGHKQGGTIRIDQVPHRQGIWRGKRKVFASHGVVSIKLTEKQTIRRLVFGHRKSPILHDVMGTWVHYHRDRHCDHDWHRLSDVDHERYQCSKCPTLRSWRAAHARGDGSKGIKTKIYSVTE